MSGIFTGVEIIGYDETEGGYFARFFDNAGNHPEYRASVSGDVWNFIEPQTRAKVVVSDGAKTMTFTWEWRQGRGAVLPLCDRIARRVD